VAGGGLSQAAYVRRNRYHWAKSRELVNLGPSGPPEENHRHEAGAERYRDAEDALLAREHGVDGIEVSNHGGRAAETGLGAIECLPEIVDAVGGAILVTVDGGFRRGTDVYKALALGARAVGIGRPYLWGLAAFGQAGVERVIEILSAELLLVMRNCGTPRSARSPRLR